MDMKITFHGGKRVNAEYNGFVHRTDQPKESGGDNTAPSPFELFLASLGACAGFYVLSFCQQRGIDTTGIELRQNMDWDPKTHMVAQVGIEIVLPASFPEKYRAAVVQAAQSCTVKKHLLRPPQFSISAVSR
jgi:ribosomal protein S12 methylthiotransferase accessory factor